MKTTLWKSALIIIAVAGDHHKDTSELERVKFVLKGGIIY